MYDFFFFLLFLSYEQKSLNNSYFIIINITYIETEKKMFLKQKINNVAAVVKIYPKMTFAMIIGQLPLKLTIWIPTIKKC